ncbi:unnamed protein product [Prorocentrum cordatum]|uniref:Uncharacterized protein n=1 Tax=Prorocentrum cordatum TaxID=2364126 RepID=A0ABN9PCL6_9DINO|nr:unnamed protein product [Polarella glacialis]
MFSKVFCKMRRWQLAALRNGGGHAALPAVLPRYMEAGALLPPKLMEHLVDLWQRWPGHGRHGTSAGGAACWRQRHRTRRSRCCCLRWWGPWWSCGKAGLAITGTAAAIHDCSVS